MTDPYEILGVRENASEAVIEAAYRQLAKKYHPDSEEGDREMFEKVRSAYEEIQHSQSINDDSSSSSNSRPTADDAEWDGLDLGGHTWGGMPVEESSASGAPDDVTVDGKYLTVSLTGLDRRDMSELTYRHNLDDFETSPVRPVATFEIHNKSGQVLRWNAGDAKFVDSEGFSYEHDRDLMIDDSNLGPRWAVAAVELEPDARSKFAIVVEDIPTDATVDKVVYTLSVHESGKTSGWVKEKERYEFNIDQPPELPDALPRS